MSDTLMFDPDQLTFIPNPAIAGDEGAFAVIQVSLAKVLASHRKSLFAHEWLDAEGAPKSIESLNPAQRTQRRTIENAVRMGSPLPMPVLGIGMLDCVEVGAGRDVLLTLAAAGVPSMPVHVPVMMRTDFQKFAVAEKTRRKNESGNVIVYILIAIVLLAALSMAVSKTSHFGSSGMVSEGRTRAALAELMSYGGQVRDAVSKLRLRGCGETQISFYSTNWPVPSDYDNPESPTDYSCHVFYPEGGKVEWRAPPSGAVTGSGIDYQYSGAFEIGGVGTTYQSGPSGLENKELIMIVPVTLPVCLALNEEMDIQNTGGIPPQFQHGAFDSKFGSFARYVDCCGIAGVNSGIPNGDEVYGKLSGCYQSNNDNNYYLYQVLIAR